MTHSTSLALLISALIFNVIHAAAPARQSLEDQLAVIDAMEDADIVAKIIPRSHEYSAELMTRNLNEVKRLRTPDARLTMHCEAQRARWTHKCLALEKELTGCDNPERRKILEAQLILASNQDKVCIKTFLAQLELMRDGKMISGDVMIYYMKKCEIFSAQTSLLLAQKEKFENENLQLQKQIERYQKFDNALQAQGASPQAQRLVMKREKKRRGSF